MRPEDLPLLAVCSSPSLSPDGATAVVAVTRPDLEADEATGALWSVAVDGSAPARRLTRGHRDTEPAVSPDGRWVAFLRAPAKGATAQLHLVELAGGEPVALTTDGQHPLGAGAPVWSPGGTALAYTARVPEPGRYGTAEGVGPDAEPPRRITEYAYRLDGVGFTRDKRPHAFVLDLDPGAVAAGAAATAPRQVTDGDADDADVSWTADGTALLLASARHATAEVDHRTGVHRVPADGSGRLAPVVGGDLAAGRPVADPDGRRLWFLAEEVGASGTDAVAQPTGLFVAPLDASAPPRRLTGRDTDLGEPSAPLRVDGRGALVLERARGAQRLLRVDGAEEAGVEVLLDGHLQATAVASTPDGSAVVAVVADPETPGDLARVAGGAAHRLTDVAAPLRAAGLRPLVEVTHPSADGYPVHGWVVLPDPEVHGPGPHPVLLDVHGGPFAQYGWGVFDEAQVHAGAGYAVVMGNPRGSAGYGEAHGRAVLGRLGGVDADDVLALLDGALADPDLPLDAARVGVMGGSYGGYMTGLLTTRTDRFAAAVVERGYLDAVSFVGSADIGWSFPDLVNGDDAAKREQSPMTHVGRVVTPTLVVHSEQDWRCPVEQGQRWFVALKRQGVETELLLFPGEGHELSRSGRPQHRLARFRHVLDWWGRHLPVLPS